MAVKPTFLTFQDQDYVAQNPYKAKLPLQLRAFISKLSSQYVQVTVLQWNQASFHEKDLAAVREEFATDDVWSESFGSIILLVTPSELEVSSECDNIFLIESFVSYVPSGPYVIDRDSGELLSIYKLYPDTHHAFEASCFATDKSNTIFDLFPGRTTKEVAVPSRIHFKKARSRPLEGLRFAVKDAIAVNGLKNSYGNKAYYDTYPAETFTAPAIQMLLDAGAMLVGQVKTSEFAEGTDPVEWLDYTCPFNSRGDREQKPSASSTGSAAACAAYDWLDFTVGTDTGGSVRHPAGVCGLFGNRPTHGAIDLMGVLGASDLLNTLGIFARDPNVFARVGSQLLPLNYQPRVPAQDRKYKLLYPIRDEDSDFLRWFAHPSTPAGHLAPADKQTEAFITSLESRLSTKRIPFNLDNLWRTTRPRGQPSTLDEAVGPIYSTLTSYSAFHTSYSQFLKDYAAANSGASPAVCPIVKARLEHGCTMTEDRVAASLLAMRTFTQWVGNILFGPFEEEAIAIMVFPQSFGVPSYRDEIPDRSKALFNDRFSIYSFGYLVGCPDYTVPVGEVPFLSRITGMEEYLPVSVSMCARPGNDVVLFDILTAMHEEGTLRKVAAGSRLYT